MYEKIKLTEILLEITSKCNLNCLHCFNRPNDDNSDMSLNNIFNIIDKCLKYDPEKIVLSGGEPFVHPEIKDIIVNCKKYPDVKFSLTTNGLLLNKEFIELIRSIPNIEIQISIDGTTKEIYEAIRGENTFARFKKGFILLANSKVKNLLARTCVTKANYKNIEEIYKLAVNNRMHPSFIFMSPQGNAKEHFENLNLSLAQKIHVIDTINRLNEIFNRNVSPPTVANTCDFAEDWERKALYVKANGAVCPCQYYYDDDVTIGNILESDLEQIFNYDNLKDLYIAGKKRKEMLSKTTKCTECKLYPTCGMGCMGLARIVGNMMGFDGECELKIMTEACYANKFIKMKKEY